MIGDVSFQGALCLGQIHSFALETHLLLFDDSEECSNDYQKLLLGGADRNGTAIRTFVPPVENVIETALLISRQPGQREKPRSILALTRQIAVNSIREYLRPQSIKQYLEAAAWLLHRCKLFQGPARSSHCSESQKAGMRIATRMPAQTVFRSISRIDGGDDLALPPHNGQASCASICWASTVVVASFRRDAISLFNVPIMVVLLLFIVLRFSLLICRKGGPLTLVSPDVQ